jgi:heat shock protein HslJ
MKINKSLFVLTLALTLSLAACSLFEQDVDLEGTSWSLVEVNGQPVVDGTAPTLVFEADRAGGNGSCNTFGGDYKVENGNLTFGPIESTLMYCEGSMDQESAYLTALQEAAGYQIKGGNLHILNADGQVTLILSPRN